ncbi:XPG I-region [Trichostrongylus colubriformis]|uniref:XPG I-region n=1 Tax=Trichostrongylus colubriformis TaxID=6319 RepID=A0AAN8FC07_TRICO
MGIAGLWPLLEPTCQPVSLETLEGKILAVDVSIWIYQAQLGYPGDVRCPHLALLVSRLCKLLYYKIRPVFVFDGEGVPSFKRKVLNERRLKKHTEEIVLSHAKKRTLHSQADVDLATGSQTPSEIDVIKDKLTAANSKRQRLENDLFDILPPKPIEVVDLSDDDEDVVVVTDNKDREMSTRTIDKLMDERERIRSSRLRPSQIPSESKSFSQFQLQRLLVRSRLNDHIKQLVENKEPLSTAKPSNMGVGAYDQHPLFSIADNSEDSSSDDSVDAGFYSKTTMIEDLVKRNVGHQKADAVMLRTDDWSSDSGTDDFIDVPSSDPLIEQQLLGVKAEEQEEPNTSQPSTSGTAAKLEIDSSTSNLTLVTYISSIYPVHEQDSDTRDSQWDDKDGFRNNVSSTRDSESYKDLQDFLTACGFPWIEAPGEAEAQCVELEGLGLVQGVISDDSDVWAFGVKHVYRHLFSKNKNVQHYDSNVVRQSLGLTQADFVGLAVLSGSDYSIGLAGIGIVNAVELLSEFAVTRSNGTNQSQEKETMMTLKNVEKWMATFDSNENTPEPIALRRKLCAVIKKNNDMERIKSIVNADIVAAYFRPNVDKSREKFRWKKVDLERVRILLYSKLGWDDEKFDKQTLIPLKRWNEFITGAASYQRHITSFTHKLQQCPAEQKTTLTKRVETALANLAKRTGSPSNLTSSSSAPSAALKKKVPTRRSRPIRKRTKKKASESSSQELQLSEESESGES